MSYNPTRAANFYRNTSKRRMRTPPKGSGVKHSDIMRRQGIGQEVPLQGRVTTSTGISAPIFEGGKFTVRTEVINAGNQHPYGVNENSDRVYRVLSGVLYVTVCTGMQNDPEKGVQEHKEVRQVQAGSTFQAAKGLRYSVSSSNAEVELLIIEDKNYDKGWKTLEEGVVRAAENTLSGTTPDSPRPTRRRDQSKAKAAAQAQARKRVPQPTTSGKVGRNKSGDANSAAVPGVNPMPAGPGAYSDE